MLKTVAAPLEGWDSVSNSLDKAAFELRGEKAEVSPEELAAQKDIHRKILAGDPDSVAACAMRCDLAAVLGAKEHWGWTLEIDSAKHVIAWWGSQPEPEQLPVLMVAYKKLAYESMAADPARAESYLRKAAALSADPRIEAAMASARYGVSRYQYYDGDAQDIQLGLIRLRYRGIPGRAPDPSILADHCQAIAAWPPAWMSPAKATDVLKAACMEALRMEHAQPSFPSAPIEGILEPMTR